jgi:hypothetical protein
MNSCRPVIKKLYERKFKTRIVLKPLFFLTLSCLFLFAVLKQVIAQYILCRQFNFEAGLFPCIFLIIPSILVLIFLHSTLKMASKKLIVTRLAISVKWKSLGRSHVKKIYFRDIARIDFPKKNTICIEKISREVECLKNIADMERLQKVLSYIHKKIRE